ncbi:hypothetical protein D9758_006321 [Tetrapyrgos nigripes]|uniref:Uncharacterized protein n=1 Tax=Tetrapyrgos nigripes TaxID=182062 RepID=A0A8H5DA61_9AGAR|nr:hypothetical protein D9758_006321 [Tetrapyrgos nigripes]
MNSNKPNPPSQSPTPSSGAQSSGSGPYTTSGQQSNAIAGSSAVGSQAYYDASGSTQPWKTGWSMTAAYPYSTTNTPPAYPHQYSYTHFRPQTYPTPTPSQPQTHPQLQATSTLPKPTIQSNKGKDKAKSPSPSPPPLEYVRYWDTAIKGFLEQLGMTQALRGFELDMLTLNEEYERSVVPDALEKLVKNLEALKNRNEQSEPMEVEEDKKSLEERKLEHVRFPPGTQPTLPSTINKSISSFLANKRAYNDASNRTEFLRSLAEKRASMPDPLETIASCARTDAKAVNRDVQMKYDVAKNEDGPLRRTVKLTLRPPAEPGASSSSSASVVVKGKGKAQNTKEAVAKPIVAVEDPLTAERYPGLDERLGNIESHLAVRFVPALPRSLLDRLKYLEEHIIRLEKEYPPWAALHFNQPNRGWPPPKSTPIIVPSHLTDSKKEPGSQNGSTAVTTPSGTAILPKGRKDSSLHRAILEKLEIQNAKNDLSTTGR